MAAVKNAVSGLIFNGDTALYFVRNFATHMTSATQVIATFDAVLVIVVS